MYVYIYIYIWVCVCVNKDILNCNFWVVAAAWETSTRRAIFDGWRRNTDAGLTLGKTRPTATPLVGLVEQRVAEFKTDLRLATSILRLGEIRPGPAWPGPAQFRCTLGTLYPAAVWPRQYMIWCATRNGWGAVSWRE